ncbi:MAG: hypothetical protein ACPG5P_02085 [Saprospiraceae bacterium]
MLENWLSPLDIDLEELGLIPSSLGKNISIHIDKDFPSLENVSVVILGLDDVIQDVRKSLYQMSWIHEGLQVADLGNFKKKDDDFIAQVLMELIDGGVFPIIITGKEFMISPQFLAHRGIHRYNNLAIVSERIPLHEESYLDKFLGKFQKNILNFAFIAYQKHYCSKETLTYIEDENFDTYRLGMIKHSPKGIEPIIRDMDSLIFNMDALKASELLAVERPTPNGLSAEEACMICRYAGISDKMGSLSISGYFPQNDSLGISAEIIAQMIWYFMDGFHARKHDYPISSSSMTEYIVDFRDYKMPITFWKSDKSGRWWMQVPSKGNKKDLKRHRLIPCSYQDYLQASNGELPERLISALHRFN